MTRSEKTKSVTVSTTSVPTLVTPTLSTLSPVCPPPLPPRSTPFLLGPPVIRPSVQLPPLPPLSPTQARIPELHPNPLITPSTSPTPCQAPYYPLTPYRPQSRIPFPTHPATINHSRFLYHPNPLPAIHLATYTHYPIPPHTPLPDSPIPQFRLLFPIESCERRLTKAGNPG